jgi:hypothetical protein
MLRCDSADMFKMVDANEFVAVANLQLGDRSPSLWKHSGLTDLLRFTQNQMVLHNPE